MRISKRSYPWQYEWKRPEWEQLPSDRVGAIDVTSALVVPCEVGLDDDLDIKLPNDPNVATPATTKASCDNATDSSPLLLIVSLLDNGNEILIDVMQNDVKRRHRDLRWPKSAIRDETLRSVTLCRKPISGLHSNNNLVDALEVVHRMALLGGPSLVLNERDEEDSDDDDNDHPSILENNNGGIALSKSDDNDNKNNADEKKEPSGHKHKDPTDNQTKDNTLPELLLACISSFGRVFLYKVKDLLQVEGKDTDDEIAMGLATMLLGVDLYQHVGSKMLPMSQPSSKITLSVPFKRPKKAVADDSPEPFWNGFFGKPSNRPAHALPLQEEGVDIGLWDGSMWNARVDASSAIHRTLDNVPVTSAHVFEYLAVLGQGTRIRRIRKNSLAHKRHSSSFSLQASRDESTHGTPKQQRGNQSSPPQSQQKSVTIMATPEPSSGDHADDWWRSDTKPEQKTTVDWWAQDLDDAAGGDAALNTSNVTSTKGGDEDDKSEKSTGQEWWTMLDNRNLVEHTEEGGFVSFVGLEHAGEMRTIYLPFAPKSIYPLKWNGMKFALVIAKDDTGLDPAAVAIRIDSNDVLTMGSTRNNDVAKMNKGKKNKSNNVKNSISKKIKRFQVIPIDMPHPDHTVVTLSSLVPTQRHILAASTLSIDPPGLVMMNVEGSGDEAHVILSYHAFDSIEVADPDDASASSSNMKMKQPKESFVIKTTQKNGHFAKIPHPVHEESIGQSWCRVGQGWSLLSLEDHFYFVCWDGATEMHGTYVTEIYFHQKDQPICLSSDVVELNPFREPESLVQDELFEKTGPTTDAKVVDLDLPFTSSFATSGLYLNNNNNNANESNRGVDEIIIDAIDSISTLSHRESTSFTTMSPTRRRQFLSHGERSSRLLTHVQSWTNLNETSNSKTRFDEKIPYFVVVSGSQQFLLTLREAFVKNGPETPFKQILVWLSSTRDYFTASSIALGLLRDVETLRDLRWLHTSADNTRGSQDHHHHHHERTSLEGLLDGIIPLYPTSGPRALFLPNQSVIAQVANMTIGCMILGGFFMAQTLESFVKRNKKYDPSKAALMLVATTAKCVSADEDIVKSAMGSGYSRDLLNQQGDPSILLWPLKCLVEVGVARDYLAPAVLLINATLPDELRRRMPSGSLTSKLPPLELCKAMVGTIIGCAPEAPYYLLGLVDEESRKRYWESLTHETRLEFSLISVNDQHPLLFTIEVRNWLLETLKTCVEAESSASPVNVYELAPTRWLKPFCVAVLSNAGCAISSSTTHEANNDTLRDVDGMTDFVSEITLAREALLESTRGLHNVDFDCLIPALLILKRRDELWYEGGSTDDVIVISTQVLLDAACHLAGRQGRRQPTFTLDAPTLMRQCALSGNISAGAYLVGGRNGLVLHCCKPLIDVTGMDIDRAESYLLHDDVDFERFDPVGKEDDAFEITPSHRQVLWMLLEHILSVRTFGDYYSVGIRGKVDPVFCARCCLRTWYLLSKSNESTPWLVRWLRRRLNMSADIDEHASSPKKLACAALVRALIWPAREGSDVLLGTLMKVENSFLVQISQSACGLIESVPTLMAEKIIATADSSLDDSTLSFPLQV